MPSAGLSFAHGRVEGATASIDAGGLRPATSGNGHSVLGVLFVSQFTGDVGGSSPARSSYPVGISRNRAGNSKPEFTRRARVVLQLSAASLSHLRVSRCIPPDFGTT